ncbi:MAG: hypothetical protein QOK19_1243 [Solirubrobacteraceae bacterium]|nr:hypothetical protein [Solirubrobacteraceae bacterium]
MERGLEARTRGNACAPCEGTERGIARHRPQGLTLTHEMFSAKVGSTTVELRIRDAVATGFGGSLVFLRG